MHHGRFVVNLLLKMWIVGIVGRQYWDMSFWIVDPLAVDQQSKTRCSARGLCASLQSFSKTFEEQGMFFCCFRLDCRQNCPSGKHVIVEVA
jgi:hypothetical protein